MEARKVTIELENHFLGTEHLAMGMLSLPQSRLERLCAAHRVSAEEVASLLDEAATPGPLPDTGQIPLSPRVRHVVRRAEELRLSSGAERIGEAHLLCAMLGAGRGVFVRVLEAFHLDPRLLAETLLAEAEGRARPPETDPSAPPPRRRKPLKRERPELETLGATAEASRPEAPEARTPSGVVPAPMLPPVLALGGINPALLDLGWPEASSGEEKRRSKGGGGQSAGKGSDRKAPDAHGTSLLHQIGRDLTHAAQNGELDPLIDRQAELEQLQRALCLAQRANPLLIGDAGVGKTALLHGLAASIVRGDVPSALRGVRLIEVPLAALPSDTQFRGELEKKIADLAQAAQRESAILVIDTAEALATNGPGAQETAALVRSLLMRGEVRIVGTTTPDAFTRHLERDTALARCFHPIRLAPPDAATTLRVIASKRARLEQFHMVHISDEAIHRAIRLAEQHMRERCMPDAAIELLDEACVKAASMPSDALDASPDARNVGTTVRADAVAAVVAQRTGRPLESLTQDERSRVASVESALSNQVVGQEEAVRRVGHRIRMFKAGLREERRPLGVLLFLGPTGVGKTELAKAAARFLFDSDERLVRLDMSEFAESHQMARLIGSPPGYVGFGEAGQLTEAVRRTPHCVLLLDEIEKAHPRIFDLFLQVFDEGRLTDGRGVTTDFTHALIVLTSNLGADLWSSEKRIGFRQAEAQVPPDMRETIAPNRSHAATGSTDGDDEEDARRRRIASALKPTFRLEFLNRLDDVILFRPLDSTALRRIAAQMIGRWQARSAEQGRPFDVDDSVLDLLCRKGYDPELGARPMKRAVEQLLVAPLSRVVLDGSMPPGAKLLASARGGRIVFEERA